MIAVGDYTYGDSDGVDLPKDDNREDFYGRRPQHRSDRSFAAPRACPWGRVLPLTRFDGRSSDEARTFAYHAPRSPR